MDDNVGNALQLTDMFFRSSQRFAETTTDLLKSMMHFWDRGHRDPEKTELNRQFDQGATPEYCFCASGSEQEQMHQRFTKDGIPHCKVTLDGKDAILFSSWDHQRAQDAIGIYRMERARDENSPVVSQDTLNSASPDQCILKNRDEAETMLIYKYCEKNGIQINIFDSEKEGYHDIQFPKREQDKMAYIKSCAALDLSGQSGKELRDYLEYRNRSFAEMQEKSLTLEKDEKIFIAGRDENQILEITENSLLIHKNGSTQKIDRKDEKDKEYVIQLAEEILEIDSPVLLTEEQMSEFEHASDKSHYLRQKEKEQGCPEISKDAYQEYRERQSIWAAYETQISSQIEGLSKFDAFEEDRALAEDCQNYSYTPSEEEVKPDPDLLKVIKVQNQEIVEHEPDGSSSDEILNMILDHEYDSRFDISATPEAQQSFKSRKNDLEAERLRNEMREEPELSLDE